MNSSESILSSTITKPTTVVMARPGLGYYGDTRVLLWKIFPPFFIIFGTTGNVLTVLVIVRQMKTLSSTAMYLLTLAFSDTLILWSGPFRNWIREISDVDLRMLTDAGCKMQLFFTYASSHFSSWILVAVTMERTISVVLPHKVKLICKPKNTAFMILALLVFTTAVDLFIPLTHALDGYKKLQCAPATKELLEFRDDVWQWIDFCMLFGLPFPFLVAGNAVIIRYLQKSRAKRDELSRPGAGGKVRTPSGPDTRKISVLMIVLCAVFLFTLTPLTIFQIYYPYRFKEVTKLAQIDRQLAWTEYQLLLLQHAIVNLVSYLNATLNFVLYVFSGTRFRTALIEMIRCKGFRSKLEVFEGQPEAAEDLQCHTISTSVPSTELLETQKATEDGIAEIHHVIRDQVM